MTTAADGNRPAVRAGTRARAARPTSASGWALRAVVSAHVVTIFGQPVFAGVYLSGDYDGLRWHAAGANVVTSIGYAQVVAAIVVWARLRRAWPLAATLALVAAETVQYFAGLAGALWLHLPLGVSTIVMLAVLFVAVWFRPLRRQDGPRERREAGDD